MHVSYLNFFEIFVHVVQKNESIIYFKKKVKNLVKKKKKKKEYTHVYIKKIKIKKIKKERVKLIYNL